MTGLEMVVVGVGLVLGWMIVTKLMTANKPITDLVPDDPDASWAAILGVSETASAETIKSAYETKVSELERLQPSIMTESEIAVREQTLAQLDAAYRASLAPR